MVHRLITAIASYQTELTRKLGQALFFAALSAVETSFSRSRMRAKQMREVSLTASSPVLGLAQTGREMNAITR